MKKTIKLLCCVAAFAILLASCGGRTNDEVEAEIVDADGNSAGGNQTGAAVYELDTTDGEAKIGGSFTEAGEVVIKIVKRYEEDEYIRVGKMTGGRITFNFPSTPIEDEYLFDFAGELGEEFEAIPEEVNVFTGDLYFRKNSASEPIGRIFNANQIYLADMDSYGRSSATNSGLGFLVYSKVDGTITGTETDEDEGIVTNASIDLKAGWNWLYTKKSTSTEIELTTDTPPASAGLKFVYRKLVDD
ncbi:MAG: hypothetical protein Ta2F_13880 [Termitinemataceae bacterium]|nr:MAG: hypothetical protein Ta2F_13880 [Termitinemataceae bacterium]